MIAESAEAAPAGVAASAAEHLTTFDIPLSRVAEIGISVTHFDQWVEFRNVSLKAGVKTEVTIATSDEAAAAQEAAVAEIQACGGKVEREAGMPDGLVVRHCDDVTDAGIEHFKDLKTLQVLVLENGQITDAGLEYLKGLSQLRELTLRFTKVTDEGVEKLQKALPSCKIEH